MLGVATLSCYLIGETSLAIECVRLLKNFGFVVRGLVSNDPVLHDWALRYSLPCVRFSREGILRLIDEKEFDYLFSVANPNILSSEILSLPSEFAINYHDSQLPRYKGVHATSWAIMNLEKQHAVTWHIMNEKIDAGAILEQEAVPIDPNETAFSLNCKCFSAGIRSFERLARRLSKGDKSSKEQGFDMASYYPKYLRPWSCAIISFLEPASKIGAIVRALDFWKYENALGSPKIALGTSCFISPSVEIVSEFLGEEPGKIIGLDDASMTVACGFGAVTFRKLLKMNGAPLALPVFFQDNGFTKGGFIPELTCDKLKRIDTYINTICRYERYWVKKLVSIASSERKNSIFPRDNIKVGVSWVRNEYIVKGLESLSLVFDRGVFIVAAFFSFLGRNLPGGNVVAGYRDEELVNETKGIEWLVSPFVPILLESSDLVDISRAYASTEAEIGRVRHNRTFVLDICTRYQSHAMASVRDAVSPAVDIIDPSQCIDTLQPPSLSDGPNEIFAFAVQGNKFVHFRDAQKPVSIDVNGFVEFAETLCERVSVTNFYGGAEV